MNIRDATESDVIEINKIYNYYAVNTTTCAQEVAESLEEKTKWFYSLVNNGLPVIVAETNGQIIAWASLQMFEEKSAYRYCAENSIYIIKNNLRSGVGTAIMNELISRARNLGFTVMVANISSEMNNSLKFHEKLGFRIVGRLEKVVTKLNRCFDAVLMQKDL